MDLDVLRALAHVILLKATDFFADCSFNLFFGSHGNFHTDAYSGASIKNKKADVVKCPKAFYHIGLLFNEPPGWAELFFV